MKFIKKSQVSEFIELIQHYYFPDFFEEITSGVEEYKLLKLYQIKILLTNELKKTGNDISVTDKFISELEDIKKLYSDDLIAIKEGDPAADSIYEIVVCYPGAFAILAYRVAHVLYKLKVKLIPRFITEYAHSRTGIDIHPGATIGKSFFIDHGTGIVIGETTIIGDNVKIYQGVTLGALSLSKGCKLKNTKRHPTIKNNVTIYSGASIFGGETIIGNNVTIGSNVFITESIQDDMMVMIDKPKLIYKEKRV